MKLRYILRDGDMVLQQSKKCPVLHRDVWEDVPLVVETDELRPITTCSNASTKKYCGDNRTFKLSDKKAFEEAYRGAEQARKNAEWFNRVMSNYADSDVSEP